MWNVYGFSFLEASRGDRTGRSLQKVQIVSGGRGDFVVSERIRQLVEQLV